MESRRSEGGRVPLPDVENRTSDGVRVAWRNPRHSTRSDGSATTKVRADRTVFHRCWAAAGPSKQAKASPDVRLRSVFVRFGDPNGRGPPLHGRGSEMCVRVGSVFPWPETSRLRGGDLKSDLKTALAKAFSVPLFSNRPGCPAPRLPAPGTRGPVPESTLSAPLDCWSG